MSVAGYYDKYWSSQGFRPTGQSVRPFQERFLGHLDDAAVLDVGCGDGTANGLIVFDRARRYVGVDVAAEAVASAREVGLTAEVVEDAASLPFEDNEFDVILCSEVLEHLFDPKAAVLEMRRVLRPDGLLVISVPNSAYWRWRLDLAVFGRVNPAGDHESTTRPWRDPHIRFFNLASMRAMLAECELNISSCTALGGTLLGDLPKVGRLAPRRGWRHDAWKPNPLYGWFEQRVPRLLGYRIFVVARSRPR